MTPGAAAGRADGGGAGRPRRAAAASATTGSGRRAAPTATATSGPYRRTADFRASTTDPDASPTAARRPGRTHLGYHDHYVVDGGKARIILTALVTPAEVQDNQPALDLLWRARFRWKLRPRQVTGDTKYGTRREHRRHRGAAHPRLRAAVGGRPPGGTSSASRTSPTTRRRTPTAVPERRRCASSRSATRRSGGSTRRRRPACRACALRAQCTTSPRGRRVGRSLDEAYLDRVRGYHATEAYAKAMRKRQGLGRAALRRGQGLARAAPLPPARAGEGQRRGAADRGRAEPEAAAQPRGLGTAPVAERGGRGRPPGSPASPARAGPDAMTATLLTVPFGRRHGSAHRVPFFNSCSWSFGPRPGQENRRPGVSAMLTR